MPGRTPPDAFRAFIEPLEAAVACLGRAKIVASSGGKSDIHREHSWTLNGLGQGMVFPGGFCFRASMSYRFIEHPEGWKVTTRGFIYSLSLADQDLWAIHWHPVGDSHETRPHLHLEIPNAGDKHVHRPVGRLTFEDAVEWVIGSGISPARDDWSVILSGSKALHIAHRSWDGDGPDGDA